MKKIKVVSQALTLNKNTILPLSSNERHIINGGGDTKNKPLNPKPPIKETEQSCVTCNSALDTCGGPVLVPTAAN